MIPDPELPDLPDDSAQHLTPAFDAGLSATLASIESAHHGHGPVHTHCENCGTKLEGPFCHRCGQHDFEFHRSFAHVFTEALETFFHFEGKFFRNIVTLLFYPGRLTAEFIAGKRATQMPPLRLYVFVSVLFFFLLFVGGGAGRHALNASQDPQAVNAALDAAANEAGDNPVVQAAIAAAKSRRAAADAKEGTAPDQMERGVHVEGSDRSAFLRWVRDAAIRANDPEYQERMLEAFLHNIPRLLLLCLPWFALYTRVLFSGSGYVYLQHLVLALHFHTFVYLWLMVRDGWVLIAQFAGAPLASGVRLACMAWLVVYPLLMFRRLFGNSWPRTLGKTAVLGAVYLVTLSVGFIGALLMVLATT